MQNSARRDNSGVATPCTVDVDIRGVEGLSTGEATARGRSRKASSWSKQAKIYWALIADSPFSTLGPPVALCALLIGLFVTAVLKLDEGGQRDKRVVALNYAELTAEALLLLVQRAILPGQTLAVIWHQLGNWPTFRTYFHSVAEELVGQAPNQTITAIDVTPNGVWLDRYPASALPPEVAHGGIDELIQEPYRSINLRLIARGKTEVQFLMDPNEFGGPRLVAFARVPVYESGVSADEDFGLPPGIRPYHNCSACYNPATRTKYMGAVGVGLDLSALSSLSNPDLKRLRDTGYRFRLTTQAVDDMLAPTSTPTLLAHTADLPGPTAETLQFNVLGNLWVLTVEPVAGWSESYVMPAIIVIVIGSVLLSILLLLVLLSRREHKLLLTSLVPSSVIRRAKSTNQFVNNAKTVALEVDTGTPAAKILSVMSDLLVGKSPHMHDVILIRTAILQSYNLYEPVHLRERMAAELDRDVTRAIMAQLGRTSLDIGSGVTQRLPSTWIEEPELSGAALGDECVLLSNTLAALMASCPAGYARSPSHASAEQGTPLHGEAPKSNPLPTASTSAAMTPNASDSASLTAGQRPCVSVDGSGRGVRNLSLLAASAAPSASPAPSPQAPFVEDIEVLLAAAMSSWELDPFALDAATQGHPLSTLAYFTMHQLGLIRTLKLKPAHLARFLRKIEDGYNRNPYHNAVHAADVLHNLNALICRGGLRPGFVDALTHMACLLAAAIHDYEHKGLTNDFLVVSSDPLALLYNDRAPMENHHLAAAFAVLSSPSCNFLSNLSKQEVATMRKIIIELVLATDMKLHFSVVSQFSTIHHLTDREKPVEPSAADSALKRAMSQAQAEVCAQGGSALSPMGSDGNVVLRPVDEAEKMLTLQVCLKCADLGHLARPLDIHLLWVARLEDEFFLQGDREKELGAPVSPLFDRDKPGVTKSQVGFFSFVAVPLFGSFTRVFKDSQPYYNALLCNKAYWEAKEREAKEGPSCSNQGTPTGNTLRAHSLPSPQLQRENTTPEARAPIASAKSGGEVEVHDGDVQQSGQAVLPGRPGGALVRDAADLNVIAEDAAEAQYESGPSTR